MNSFKLKTKGSNKKYTMQENLDFHIPKWVYLSISIIIGKCEDVETKNSYWAGGLATI